MLLRRRRGKSFLCPFFRASLCLPSAFCLERVKAVSCFRAFSFSFSWLTLLVWSGRSVSSTSLPSEELDVVGFRAHFDSIVTRLIAGELQKDSDEVTTFVARVEERLEAAMGINIHVKHETLCAGLDKAGQLLISFFSGKEQQEQVAAYRAEADRVITALMKEIEVLKTELDAAKSAQDALRKRVSELEPSHQELIARQAVMVLETFLVIEAMGSKTRAKNTYVTTAKKLVKEAPKFPGVLVPSWLTQDHVKLIESLKEKGTAVAHPATFSKADLEGALLDPDDDEDKKQAKAMLVAQLGAFYSAKGLAFGTTVKL